MGLLQFEIILDNPYAAYFPGALVSGNLHVCLDKPKTFRKIVITCKGEANVRWSETRTTGSGDNRRTQTVYFTSHQKCLELQQVVNGGDGTYELQPGQYTYRFDMRLPSGGLPSSFEGQYGHVRYCVKAKIDRPWRFDNETKKMITLNSIVDLNNYPECLTPQHQTDHKRVCCLCCRSGKITASASLSRTGYVPGEYVEFNANVDNKSYNSVLVNMKLVENITYKAQGKHKTESRLLLQECGKFLDSKSTETWDHEGLVLPPMAPTGLPYCDIIDTNHILEFEVDPGFFSFDLELPFKIKVGTIPYVGRYSTRPAAEVKPLDPERKSVPAFPVQPPYPVPAGELPGPSAPALSGPDNPPSYNNAVGGGGFYAPFVSSFPTYPDMPPPTYAESAFGADDVRDEGESNHTSGPIGFAPKYPSYNWQNLNEAKTRTIT